MKRELEEIAFLQEFSKEVINQNYREFLGDEAVDYFINSGASDQYISDNINEMLVAESLNKVVGICVCKKNTIDLLMVKTELHRQGIGRFIINEISKELLEKYDRILVESFESNKKANQFYEKTGWRTDKIEFDEEIGINRIYYSIKR